MHTLIAFLKTRSTVSANLTYLDSINNYLVLCSSQSLDWIIRNKVVSTQPVVYNIYIFIYMNSPNLSVNVIRIQIFNCRSGLVLALLRSPVQPLL